MKIRYVMTALLITMTPVVSWAGTLLQTPAAVPALDGWGGVLLVGVLAGVFFRWAEIIRRRK